MEELSFKVSARTTILMGRENIANSEGALIELIKNSYDADATHVFVHFEPNNIYIIDNGEGMNDEIIKNKWMIIGTNNKEANYISKNGRIKSGAKGIGRFALDKLGKSSKMITFPNNYENGFIWTINWNEFEEKEKTIDEIRATLKKENKKFIELINTEISNKHLLEKIRSINFKTGTLIKIENTREFWSKEKMEKIFNNFSMLIPPYSKNIFNIQFSSNNEKPVSVLTPEVDFYTYGLKSKYDGKENISINIYRNELDFKKMDEEFFIENANIDFSDTIKLEYSLEELINTKSDFEIQDIGEFEFDIYFLKKSLRTQEIEKKYWRRIDEERAKNTLNYYSGIKIFRDGFKVRPYGEYKSSSFDWLQLRERVDKNPAGLGRSSWNVSPSNVLGAVYISRVNNPSLEDKSSREGIQENDAFNFFKVLLTKIIGELEKDRSNMYQLVKNYLNKNDNDHLIKEQGKVIINKKDEKTEDIKDKEGLKKAAEKNPEALLEKLSNVETLVKYGKIREKENIELMKENQLLRTLASSGLVLSSLSHEIKNLVKKEANEKIDFIEEETKANNDELLNDVVKGLRKDYSVLSKWIDFSLNVLKKDKRKRRKNSLTKYFEEFKLSWAIILNTYKAKIEISSKAEEIFLISFISDIESIFINLILNSIEAFQRKDAKEIRKINIKLDCNQEYITIDYSDTGPGLLKTIKNSEEIYNPLFTTKIDSEGNEIGTGLGMTVVSKILDEYEAKYYINKNYLGGFNFIIQIPLKKKGDGISEID